MVSRFVGEDGCCTVVVSAVGVGRLLLKVTERNGTNLRIVMVVELC